MHDGAIPHETGKRLRSNSFGHKILQPEKSPGLKKIERADLLGADSRQHV
jgi:hypothetical protein